MKKVSIESAAIGTIAVEVLLAALYQMTVGKQLQYYGYVSIHDGVRYGLIALNPLRDYPIVAIIAGTILAGVFSGFIKNTRTAFVLSITQISLLIIGVGLAFSDSGGRMMSRLDIESRVYFLVSRSEAEYGQNSYLLECEGAWGVCKVLGSIHGVSAELDYDKQNQAIVIRNAAQEQKEFKINPP